MSGVTMRTKRILATGLFTSVLSLGALLPQTGIAAEEEKSALPIEELRVFAEVFSRIKQDYVEPVEDKVLLRYAIEGMLSGLDPHSAYLAEEDYAELRVGTSGQFGGVGIEVGPSEDFIKVISPIDDTPAQRAGIQAGDIIVRIDGRSIKGLDLDEAVGLMRGEPDSKITLTIVREGRSEPFDVSMERAIIKVASVKERMLEKDFGYVRISQFQSQTGDDLIISINKLMDESNDNLKGLVLDLRNNPGGVLNAAVAVSDAFLTDGLVVYTEGRVEDTQLKFSSAPDDVLNGAPIVVLVNQGSASASEIVAGALQDHRRAVIMGQTTFGKGSVQTIVPVNEKTAVKLTTARYYTPNGRSIQAEGIRPDIELENYRLEKDKDDGTFLKEADLSGHLENPEAEEGKDAADSANSDSNDTDYVLNEALNLLKGLAIMRSAQVSE